MLAEPSSPAPDADAVSALYTPEISAQNTPGIYVQNTPEISANSLAAAPAPIRKRKRAAPPPPAAPSPAPSDPGSASNPPELLTSRVDLTSRPQLSISRGPIFVPVAEGDDYHITDLVGVNRVGYRYVPAGINPPGYTQPCRTIESNPSSFRVSWEDRSPFITVTKDGLGMCGGTGFRSARCNAPITEGKWYMEVKIVHGGGEHHTDTVHHEGSHVRLGWGRREAPLNGPVGLDAYSYGYRDKTGDKVTLSRPRPYGRAYGTGDVIGMYISLPSKRVPDPKDPHDPAHVKRERIPIDLKGQEVFEILEYTQCKEMSTLMDYSGKASSSASVPSAPSKKAAGGSGAGKPERGGPAAGKATGAPALRPLPTLVGSRIAFFVNGECQGTAFQDVYDYLQLRQSDTQRKAKEKSRRAREGVKEHRENPFNDGWLGYYPFISLFNDACVQLNPGPEFAFPPPDDVDAVLDGTAPGDATKEEDKGRTWRPTCERYPEFMAEQWALDEVEEEEARVEAARMAEADKADAAKKAERQKKRQQTEARKRAKVAAAAAEQHQQQNALYLQSQSQGGAPAVNDERGTTPGLGLGLVGLGQPSPSPLRHGTTYGYGDEGEIGAGGEGEVESTHSPALTFASNGEFQGGQSGYNSDNMETEVDFHSNLSAEVQAPQPLPQAFNYPRSPYPEYHPPS
ncbi:hypothetical protein DXG03_001090 [Asterophora parasitica]|uniref:B30.2/SPRY domain-containing protein n=1 Tax=Asterophora parasitica TaxID=117018 RepID=A0A9P7GD30_9AGAR|nr:hypothetical protein DXG03_001090 [Asterophora parasitica]